MSDFARVLYCKRIIRNTLLSRVGILLNSRAVTHNRLLRVRSAFFRKLRSAHSLYFEHNAVKRGLFPKRDRSWKRRHGKNSRTISKDESIRRTREAFFSVFDRRNKRSMNLVDDFKKSKFRFIRVPTTYSFRHKTRTSLRLLARKVTQLLVKARRASYRLAVKSLVSANSRRLLKRARLFRIFEKA